MHAEELRSALHTEPFKSFLVRMASGKTIPITNPELAVVSSTGRTAFVFHDGADGFDVIDMRLVESIEFPKQGRGGRRRVA